MVKTDNQSKTISGFFGISEARKNELYADFEKLFKTQAQEVIDEYLQSVKDYSATEDTDKEKKLSLVDNVKILDEFLLLAKTPKEQLFCVYHATRQILDYRDRIELATKHTMLQMLTRK